MDMTNETAIKGLKHLKSFIRELKTEVMEDENMPPSDWVCGFYNWCSDPIDFVEAINLAIEKLEETCDD